MGQQASAESEHLEKGGDDVDRIRICMFVGKGYTIYYTIYTIYTETRDHMTLT